MRILREPVHIIRGNTRPFFILNALAFGLFLVGCVLGWFFPELVEAQAADFEESGAQDLALTVFQRPWLFALVIFAVNTFQVGAAMIVLPSMLVPFLGIALFAYKALTLSMAIVPTTPTLWVAFIPHSLTLVIEFEAYVLFMLGAWILGRSWLRPGTVRAATRRQAYLLALRRVGWLSLAAVMLLVVGALWEAWSLTQLLPWLVHVLL